jgi:hypothetical protein
LSFLDKNNDVFTWSTSDLVGISRDVIEHRLQVSPNARPKKQKLHKMVEEKVEAMKVEVRMLLDAGFIREVTYPEWLANVVMVKKKNGKWGMCTNFTDPNYWALKVQVDRYVLSYVDDIVVVSKKKEDYLLDLTETFTNMREAKLKLNPENVCLGLQGGRSLVV